MTRDETKREARREIDRANWIHDLIAEAMTPSAEIIDIPRRPTPESNAGCHPLGRTGP